MSNCSCYTLVPVAEFNSPDHYQQILKKLTDLVAKGELSSVKVGQPYSPIDFEEHWYRCGCGKVWRLVRPEFPFKGLFEPVV